MHCDVKVSYNIHYKKNLPKVKWTNQILWLIDYLLFYVPLKNFSLIWVTIAGKGL
jgi:hypothetical protein